MTVEQFQTIASLITLQLAWIFAIGRWRQHRREREIADLRHRLFDLATPWRPPETDEGRDRWYVQ